MNKEETLAFIKQQIATGVISPLDLEQTPESGTTHETHRGDLSKKLITTFYIIGALIVMIGAVVFVGQNWDTIGAIGRILVTLGISFATFAVAMITYKPEQKTLSQVLFVISAVLAPLGVYTLLEAGTVDFEWYIQCITALCLFVIYAVAFSVRRASSLILVNIAYASWAYMSLMSYIIETSSDFQSLINWAFIILGASYLLIGQSLLSLEKYTNEISPKENSIIRSILTTLGTLGILTAGSSIGGVFDIFFVLFIFAGFYGSVYLKSRSMLVFAALFLVIHIIKLTATYFVYSIGWPIALIMVGFLVIGIGYMTYQLNLKYISNK